MDTKVAMMCRAVKAKVDAEGDRGPGRIFAPTVKAYLRRLQSQLDLLDPGHNRVTPYWQVCS